MLEGEVAAIRKQRARGVQRNLKGRGGETEGEGRILRKINYFCGILFKMSQKGGGATPLYTPMQGAASKSVSFIRYKPVYRGVSNNITMSDPKTRPDIRHLECRVLVAKQ